MMLETIRGRLDTVAVTSLNAYSFLSAGAISDVYAAITRPMLSVIFYTSSRDNPTLNPLIASSLSRVPPVGPSPRPDIIGILTPWQASSGARISDVLSPYPPVECLSTRYPPFFHFITLPDSTMAFVKNMVSSKFIPWKQIAIARADI
jgi:hypothetical protein